MAKRLPAIPRCKECGNEIFNGGSGLCTKCQKKRTRESIRMTMDAEKKMSGAESWRSGYNPWKNIVAIPLTIAILIIIVIGIVLLSN